MTAQDGPRVNATVTSIQIIEAVQDLDGAGVSELARYLDRSKSGVYKHVMTLSERGYLVKEDDTYHLGLELWTLGTTVRDRLPIDVVRPTIDDLAASINQTVGFAIYENGTAAYAYRASPDEESDPISEGDPVPLHATAAGKAILAYLAADKRDEIIDGELSAYTDETVTDRDVLIDELRSVRGQRLAFDSGEYDPTIECVASPILDSTDSPIGAITVASTSDDGLRVEEKVTGLLVSASKSIENVLAADE